MIPQAYTARDLSEAYKWIQSLTAPARDELKTMEQMVYAYLKAKNQGNLRSQEFQKTLQTLKVEMDQFDFQPGMGNPNPMTEQNALPAQHQVQQSQQFQQAPHQGTQPKFISAPSAQASLHLSYSGEQYSSQAPQQAQQMAPNMSAAPAPSAQPAQPAPTPQAGATYKLDFRSQQIIEDIRLGLNLSSDLEVIRMSLVLAHKTIKNLID